jgi:hypothetical protein
MLHFADGTVGATVEDGARGAISGARRGGSKPGEATARQQDLFS